MNLVSLIIAPAVVVYTVEGVGAEADGPVRWIIAGLAVAALVAAILVSKRRSSVVEAGEARARDERESVEVG
jgi:K(+)-stimulated pyrophosphate-energized sodium pump